jgi:hypothetical protein
MPIDEQALKDVQLPAHIIRGATLTRGDL